LVLIKNIGFYNNKTGEDIKKEIFLAIQKQENNKEITKLYNKAKDDIDSLTLEELEDLRKLLKLKGNISLDFTNDKYFTIKNNLDFIINLSIHTRGTIYTIGHMITHDGRIKYNNNRLISNFDDLRNYLNINKTTWSRHIKPDIDAFQIIVKEKLNNKWCLLMNPIFAVKDRSVTETMFIAFHESLEEYLHPIDYLYLCRLHNINLKNTLNMG